MPMTKGLRDRFEKFTGKTPPDVTGSRYAASKAMAVARAWEFASPVGEVVELARDVLEAEGVPAGQHAVYYAFVQKVRKAMFSHRWTTLSKIVSGLKSYFVQLGADPALLDKLSKLMVGG